MPGFVPFPLLGRDKAQVIPVACEEGVAGTGELAEKVEQVFRKVKRGWFEQGRSPRVLPPGGGSGQLSVWN